MDTIVNTRIQGEITELKCQLYCLQKGFTVSKPIVDNARYDLILDYNNKLYKIQIKTSRWMNDAHEGFVFSCKSQHRTSEKNKIMKYTPEEVDFFMTCFENQYYLIPCDRKRAEIRLRFKPTKNHQDNKANFAKDYLFDTVIQTI